MRAKHPSYTIKLSHPMYKFLVTSYGSTPGKKRNCNNDNVDEGEDDF